ncbi:MAG: hypothetical protein COW00_12835 [Bdellovibrio sp. CG12_big_fil_rev_8_21_14_0_65_39_13]|nr:MAG: hypothetical protein COW78_05155 [Bdellovibrio sp. CG22_combo_CG10-13_8_21_14_all_39_27]PIQ58966.1 MAG: hypothetical protein COW00_12835 [Bdellovibrio sp. CG12_big_fil_rev_8_21_14_0_65_39_13]PIR33934.1 MAG: hypothetical protein COV37_14550 [Bdellovibrio sp. CG11_big_fil_rev_8_21_14_0_20_39_38]
MVMNKKFFINLCLVVNVVLYFVAIGLWISIPDELTICGSITIFNLSLSVFVFLLDKPRFSFLYQSEQFKRFLVHAINGLLVFFILGLINYVSFKHPIQWDFTSRKSNTLTQQTAQVLKSIDEEVTFIVFSRKADFGSFRQLLELFKFQKSNVQIDFVDIELMPHLVQKYNVTKNNSVVVEYKGKNLIVEDVDELHLVNAMVRLSKREDPLIGVVTGHGEISWQEQSKDGLSALKVLLTNSNYLIQEIALSQVNEISSAVSVVVIWGPKEGFFDSEIKVLRDYLKNGGKLLVALDPQINGDKLGALRKLITEYDISISNDLVLDRLKHVNQSNGTVPIVEKLNPDHPVTKGIEGVFFPLSSSVMIVDNSEKAEVLAETTPFPASWADKNPKELLTGKMSYDDKVDTQGPIGLMAISSDKDTKAKVVAFGTSNFILNSYARFSKNFNLVLNSVAWLAGADELISFNIPTLRDEPVFISGPLIGTIFYFSVVFSPLILVIISIAFYRRRSKL